MDYNTAHLNSWPAKLVIGIGHRFRSSRAYTMDAIEKKEKKKAAKLKKRNANLPARKSIDSRQSDVNELGEREYSVFSDQSTLVEGKRTDNTDMIHSLAHHDSFDSLVNAAYVRRKLKFDDDLDDTDDPILQEKIHELNVERERMIESLPTDLWQLIASYLPPSDAAHLAMASWTLHTKLGKGPLQALDLPEHRNEKIRFLNHMDWYLPGYILCFPCAKYHHRTRRGSEKLYIDYVGNPLYICPSVKSSYLPRMAITWGRELPYSFVQLTTRAAVKGKNYGIDASTLDRKWKCPVSTWSHHTRYHVHDGRLLMRVRSQTYADSKLTETAVRHLLYDREEYRPYFSVCAHWQDGELMPLVKCALSHIPSPPKSIRSQLKEKPKVDFAARSPQFIVTGCDDCRPARRCPECPTEYLIEVNMAEDTSDPVRRFKHVIVVTRWSDLGNGSSPHTSPEWTAINGKSNTFDSFTNVGRRAVAGIFESKVSGSIPGQRMLSLNPKNEKLGEEGHGWY
ncbi:hypothetical protein K431DRAFT_300759 [Polychaeton citri CBS 116435]|uniref:F-box domain-containing protein n=1 Tax=Polychaeton citri CBS 116435 TaxID=1314669 RepID=A0A9P4QGE2_9PEZI|nr:hypothetical protein K431DRAFT_300759 [Polychaeton citri CBS 116435]